MNNKVKFLRGTSGEYAVAEKDSDTIYFTTDDGKLYIGDKKISGDGSITIDDTLSDTSTNPVQGNVIKQAIDSKADKTVATISADGLMSAEDKTKLDSVGDTYALKSKYGDTTIDVGRKSGTTVGIRSTAEGNNTTASGAHSHAEGAGTTASDSCSHAEGYLCTASSDNSHAEGNNTTASGAHSHSEGDSTIASGIGSHSGGTSSTASGDYSFAHGMYVESNNSCEVSLGKFNKSSSDTRFSIGDGTSDTARHNAFEITASGGKLHDKDIATTDLIPTELPANGGNADTVNSLKAYVPNYLDIFSTTLSLSHPCWNKKCDVYGQSNDINAETYIDNAPEIDNAVWYEVETIGNGGRAYQIAHGCYIHQRKSFIRYMHDAVWSDWFEIYTSNSKPYISGSATVAANSTTCTSNHGFTPSAVIWWDGNYSGVATSFNGTQFTFDKTRPVDRIISYLIFK